MATAEDFIRAHAEKACSGRIPEVMADLTPEAMQQAMVALAGGPNPPTGNTVTAAGQDGDDLMFDVTYTGDDGKSASIRDYVRQVDGTWKIVRIEKI
jgi:hypothetical protein